MSFNVLAVGKPSEIRRKVALALENSASQSYHRDVLAHLKETIASAVEHIPDTFPENWGYPEGTTRKIIVEASGHIDSTGATLTLSVRTFFDWGVPVAVVPDPNQNALPLGTEIDSNTPGRA